MRIMRETLQSVLTEARELPAPELPRLLGELEEIRATALARLTAPAPASRPDALLTIEQASERLGMSENYLYRHSDTLPFVRRMGRSLRFSGSGIDDYIYSRKRSR